MLFSFGACQDMLDVDSNRVIFEDDNEIKNPGDAYYTISGILEELQYIGDRYVILGELRGDLMTISQEYSSVSLKEIYEFQTTENNVYRETQDYYSIINNCNYAIQKMDTSLVSSGEKVMIPAYVEIKTIRAWAYWQMAQVFGTVKYLEKPVMSLEESLAEYPEMNMDQLAEKLIADLSPYAAVRINNSSNQGLSPNYNSSIQVQMMLGDLYLYQNKYTLAAQMYFNFMSSGSSNGAAYTLSGNFTSKWNDKTFLTAESGHRSSYLQEWISDMYYSSSGSGIAKDNYSKLISLTFNDKTSLLPEQTFINEMGSKTYIDMDEKTSALTTTYGDLRGYIPAAKSRQQVGDAYYYVSLLSGNVSRAMIYKYYFGGYLSTGYDPDNNLLTEETGGLLYLSYTTLFRHPHLYLRYAEAVNRAGKPTLAYAVLKHGLTKANVADPKKVNQSEIKGEAYTDIPNTFDSNVGTMSRGLGTGISRDSIYYVIPELATLQDSIEWVELRILDELAAETSFEGNRFFDLLRVSRRRPNHPEFMADRVSAKYADPAAMKARLMNMDTWFMK